jgi:hypothetical protein
VRYAETPTLSTPSTWRKLRSVQHASMFTTLSAHKGKGDEAVKGLLSNNLSLSTYNAAFKILISALRTVHDVSAVKRVS